MPPWSDPLRVLAELAHGTTPVIIHGAGLVGRELLALCRERGVAVAAFTDNSTAVIGTRCDGLEVLAPEHLPTHFPEAEVLVATASIRNAVDHLTALGYPRCWPGALLLPSPQRDWPARVDNEAEWARETCRFCHTSYLHPDRLALRSVDLVITERCSLRCRDCANLMQYYTHPRHHDPASLLAESEHLYALIDDLLELRIIGGEAFLHPHWTTLVARALAEPKVRRVVVYTNATVLPPEPALRTLQHDKASVIITDYGPLSGQFAAMTRQLTHLAIAWHALRPAAWLDCATIGAHRRTPADQRRLFQQCCGKNMLTLLHGRLFRCPFAANAHNLGAVPDQPGDYLDLGAPGLSDPALSWRTRLRTYIERADPLEICDYCSGRPLAGNEVPPAVQMAKPRPCPPVRRTDPSPQES